MKKLLLYTLMLGAITLCIESCQKLDTAPNEDQFEENYLVVPNTTLCGHEQYDLMSGTRGNIVKIGEVEVANDNQNLYVDLTTLNPAYTQYKLFVGNCQSRAGGPSNNPDLYDNPLTGTFYTDSALITIPLSSLEPCFCIVARITTPTTGEPSDPDMNGSNTNVGGAAIIDYCKVPCPTCNTNNVFGMGGWGAKPAGNNPGTYLHANFATWYPNGLTLGCAGGYTLKLSTAQNVTDFLPQGGTPKALTQNYVNPTARISVLAGHLLTLTLNMASNPSLGSQTINGGDFAGLTVNQLLAQANNFFGGCIAGDASKYSAALSGISNNPSHSVSCD